MRTTRKKIISAENILSLHKSYEIHRLCDHDRMRYLISYFLLDHPVCAYVCIYVVYTRVYMSPAGSVTATRNFDDGPVVPEPWIPADLYQLTVTSFIVVRLSIAGVASEATTPISQTPFSLERTRWNPLPHLYRASSTFRPDISTALSRLNVPTALLFSPEKVEAFKYRASHDPRHQGGSEISIKRSKVRETIVFCISAGTRSY